ncbi:hypothetical protein [Nannocystis radixulma]|uniref:Uncharacterized protein n=1 Tax=Nannocystis radixulma TaxID=2995305 RepID=A0ABT5BA15_9BACT|nr:hypothetical protein [Nannocystis radixulma]MDC0670268.1 hypothetical protein [Nannocystis radixulma]
MVHRNRACVLAVLAASVAGVPALHATAAGKPAGKPPAQQSSPLQPAWRPEQPKVELYKVEKTADCRETRPPLQAFQPRASLLIDGLKQTLAQEYVLTRREKFRPNQPGSFARFTSTTGLKEGSYNFSTDDRGNVVLKVDTRAQRKYALTCQTYITMPPVSTHGSCTHPYVCKETVNHRQSFNVNCEGPWADTDDDQTAWAGDPFGGWKFIRKWGPQGLVDQLVAQGWVLEPCFTQPMTCVPDKNKVFYEVCPRTHTLAHSPSTLFERCDISQFPIAMVWEIEAAAPGKPYEQLARGLPLPTEGHTRFAPAAEFIAPADQTTTFTVDYPLNNLVTAGYGRSLVVEQIESDAQGACTNPEPNAIKRERVYRAQLKPVAWKLTECEVAEFELRVKP